MAVRIPTCLRILAAAWLMAGQAVAAGDPEQGAKAFQVCTACHSLRPDVNLTGPSLAGVWGRTAGSLPSFHRYSPALRQSGVTWNEQTLDAWLAEPGNFIPNNHMTIQGIPDTETRANLIAFVRLASPNGPTGMAASLPEATEPDLKSQPAKRQVRAIRLCGDTYRVATGDGTIAEFWERNLRFKTDSSAQGPTHDAPAIMPAGMLGDRATVIFSRPEEINAFIKRAC